MAAMLVCKVYHPSIHFTFRGPHVSVHRLLHVRCCFTHELIEQYLRPTALAKLNAMWLVKA